MENDFARAEDAENAEGWIARAEDAENAEGWMARAEARGTRRDEWLTQRRGEHRFCSRGGAERAEIYTYRSSRSERTQ